MVTVSAGQNSNPLQVVHGTDRPMAEWEAVYREHVVALYRYVYRRTGNRVDAEDVTSMVFMRALPRLRSPCSDGETRAYLQATARTVLADLWRERHRVTTQEVNEDTLSALEVPERPEPDVEHLLSDLPPHYRQVLELRFLSGYSIRETAQAMGISVNNAKVMQLRALRRAAQRGTP